MSDVDSIKKKNTDIKILFLGEPYVGKTTLLLKYFEGEFIVNLDITYRGVNLFRKTIVNDPSVADSRNIFLNIWDIAGNKNYNDFFTLITQPLDAIIILTDTESDIKDSVGKWIELIDGFVNSKFLKFLLILEKNNTPLNISLDDLISKHNITSYSIIDAKNTKNVNEAFDKIFKVIINSDRSF